MFMGKDKQGIAALIVSRMKPGGDGVPKEGEHSEGGEGELHPGLHVCASEMIAALHAKDAAAFGQALDHFLDIRGADEEHEEQEAGEGKEGHSYEE